MQQKHLDVLHPMATLQPFKILLPPHCIKVKQSVESNRLDQDRLGEVLTVEARDAAWAKLKARKARFAKDH